MSSDLFAVDYHFLLFLAVLAFLLYLALTEDERAPRG